MKIVGTTRFAARPEQVWEALHNPAVLARTLPGCEALEAVGEDAYRLTVTAGVSAVRGRYDGEVAITDREHLESFVLQARGAGTPGTVSADVLVRMAADGAEHTMLSYEADAVVGGPIGGVGQRMLTGVSRKMADQFFAAVQQDLAVPAVVAPTAPGPMTAGPGPGASPSAATPSAEGVVFPGRAAYAGRQGTSRELALGVAVGGFVALAGVVIGAVIGRRGS